MEEVEYDEEEEGIEPVAVTEVVKKKKVPAPPQDELEFQLAAQRSEEEKIAAGHYYTDPADGTVFEWDEEQRAWFPRVTEDFLAAYQMSYGVTADSATKAAPATPPPVPRPVIAPPPSRKPVIEKGIEEVLSDAREGQNKELKEEKKEEKKQKQAAAWFDLDDENNTWIYITGLPLSTTDEDFVALMGKYGLIKEEEETQKKKYKMYKDSGGKFKGDATCCFLRRESISLCMQMLEGCKLPEGTEKVHVELAKFQLKGEYDPKLKPKKKKNNKKKKKVKQENALDWRERAGGTDLRPKEAKIVVMKHCFNPKDFLEDATLITDIRDDIKEECEKIGPVKKVLIFDRHPQGVVSVKFGTHEAADEAVKKFNGRFFAGQKLEAEVYDGVTDFAVEETAMERQERLDHWHKYIEGEDKTNGAPSTAKPVPKLTVLSMADFMMSDDEEEDEEQGLKEEIERMRKEEEAKL